MTQHAGSGEDRPLGFRAWGDSSLSDELGPGSPSTPGHRCCPPAKAIPPGSRAPCPGPPSSTFPGLRPCSRAGGEPCSLLRPPAFLQMRFRLPGGFPESARPNQDHTPMGCGSLASSCLHLKDQRSKLRKLLASRIRARIQTQTCPPPGLCPAPRVAPLGSDSGVNAKPLAG